MEKQRIVYLLKQHRKGLLTTEEQQELLDLVRQDSEASFFVEAMMEDMESDVFQYAGNVFRWTEMSEKILAIDSPNAEREPLRSIKRIHFLRRWGWAAAAVILLLAGGTYLILNRTNEKPIIAIGKYKGDVPPGHNGAVLHLSNGNTVALDSAQDGRVATQGSMQAVKVDGELKYVGKTTEIIYNTVTTGRGRQWQLTLPDGTKVWLNAASSIHYPLMFTGSERVVDITGEAYFEVVHNSEQPFKVKVGGQVIEDIGTSFNINAYTDEPAMKTTLVEGAVSVNGTTLLPGHQAAIINGQLKVSPANIDQVLAWKNGSFSFDKADIYTVMRQLSRWYNVEVKFEGKPETVPFQGEIGRGLTLAQVLKILEQVSVHFRIEEDKRIVILP